MSRQYSLYLPSTKPSTGSKPTSLCSDQEAGACSPDCRTNRCHKNNPGTEGRQIQITPIHMNARALPRLRIQARTRAHCRRTTEAEIATRIATHVDPYIEPHIYPHCSRKYSHTHSHTAVANIATRIGTQADTYMDTVARAVYCLHFALEGWFGRAASGSGNNCGDAGFDPFFGWSNYLTSLNVT